MDATAEACLELLSEIAVEAVPARFRRSSMLGVGCFVGPAQRRPAAFACVDSMSGRR